MQVGGVPGPPSAGAALAALGVALVGLRTARARRAVEQSRDGGHGHRLLASLTLAHVQHVQDNGGRVVVRCQAPAAAAVRGVRSHAVEVRRTGGYVITT